MAKAGPTIEQVPVTRAQAPPPPTPGPAPAPAAPAPVNLRKRRGWRPGLLLFGLFLVLASMLGGILLLNSVATTTPVLVAAADLERGQVLTVSDVRVAEVSLAPDVNVLELAEQQFLGGESSGEPVRSLKGFVPEGTILSEDHFVVRSQVIGPNDALVGLRLASGEYPSLLKVGDQVEMFEVIESNTVGADADAVYLGRAEVWRTWQAVSETDRTLDLVADLLIDDEAQPSVVQAHARDRLRLTVIQDEQDS